ncbi:type 1 glutamine amidotransferase [Paenibacillus guangzhouensis]|uniref:type 1 glutamine amidotransferase n=1 Tax=Paenibacillus guangzhouensis TaxID=1473112 RepID=UPI001266DEC1|nr:type 1 glutamine amidotransferase [Paenibacillus guangzhouensis]
MHIHFVIHEVFEGPGAFLTWAEAKGHRVSYSRVYQGEQLPRSIEEIDLLIVMGGPQSPSTTIEMCPHFNAALEMALIQECVESDKAVLGVCLGAQLIGEALGARCEHNLEKEIGCFPITLTEEGNKIEFFSHFGDTCVVGHWHNDMPGLTARSQVVAYSEGCPRQIVRYQEFVYGFQCHMEFTSELIELLIAHSEEELAGDQDKRFVQRPEELRNNDYTAMNNLLFSFLDKFVDSYLKK